MMAMCRLPLLSVVCMLPLIAHAEHRHSISAHQEKGFLRAIDDDLRGEVNRAISDALGGAHNFAKGHLGAVRVALSPMWKALAKDEHGRIDLRSLQYVVQRYMLHAYHLSIIGFEQGQNSNSSESKLMQMAPSFVKRAVDGDDSMRGFSLDDTVAMIALIEEMLVHPGSNMLSRVYTMKGYNVRELVSREKLQSALESYLIRWLLTDDSTSRDYLMFRSDHELVQSVDNWTDMTQLLAGHVQEFAYRNAQNYPSNARNGRWTPLKDSFSFADASEIVRRITMSFGEYWRSECVTVKESLVKLDRQRIGRVKLSDFHGAALNGEWRFSESVSYLRELGALDESSSLAGPRVIVANYLQGASNCIVSDQRYRVCCANDCETYMSEIEEAVAAPAASPEFLFEVVSNITADLEDNRPALTATLRSQLWEIAHANGGQIYIHGRLFAQWLHYVFPRDCPFPHKAGTVASVSPRQFGAYQASDDELQKHAEQAPQASRDEGHDDWMSQWSHEEEHLSSHLKAPWQHGVATVRLCAGVLIVLAIVVAVFGRQEATHDSAKKRDYVVGSSSVKDLFV